ncbi:ATP synthase f1, gamma subunit [Heliomicrobium modesticaldum Ice1]|uniref:ATP synthase gamma chain n=1 Tax=Heliobacterium modesticaldum (strain ATCC 51547 / Ice1) TaxID=498761 RepID=ATPG_HELMI|nr:ATP synthase F1 subunit gamma [Heliomicrobium modesticaldum]B0THN3.1 RecName: Full=ATP synthase gamma chain; AltName: Full=ATP synthase F1 sector gamma subunit; AltName: Full=F-ATPase gamma subunit [Heliomicrobium modesticaldum Ice1]ABZ83471.1 ATP synthase f1, gamma subunit [Heliomicrobium modesticaldum Ice1]
MPGMRDIKRRIRSIKSTQQITKAMKMVAAAKLRKAQEKVIQARPYAKRIQGVLSRLVAAASDVNHPLLTTREVKRVGYVVITADRGLCGGYNANIIRKVNNEIKGRDDVSLVCVGRKSRDFFKRMGKRIEADYVGLGEDISFGMAKEIAAKVMELYEQGTVDQVQLVFTEFYSALTQKPVQMQLLPIPAQAGESANSAKDSKGPQPLYAFEPSPEAVLDELLPKYVENQIYRALLESKASEQGARMTAMGSATDNAKEMINKLTLSFNRARQAAITKEISEVVGGAAALG